MYKFKESAGGAVAAETQSTLAALDSAMLCETQLIITALEAVQGSTLTARKSQEVLETMAEGMNHVVAARASLVATITKLTAIKSHSNFAVHAFGCPTGLEARLSHSSDARAEIMAR